jgi:hypothetical protein
VFTGLSAAPPRRLGRRQRAALRSLYDRRLRKRWGIRTGTVFGFGIGFGYATAILVISRNPQPVALENVIVNATIWLSWLAGGLVGLSYARHLSEQGVDPKLKQLAALRGYPGDVVAAASTGAAMWRIVVAVGVPALLLVLLALALSASIGLVIQRALFGLALFGYIVFLAFVLAWLARWSARVSEARAGTAFLALALVPHLARQVWPATPSVPALLEWLLWQVGLVPAV